MTLEELYITLGIDPALVPPTDTLEQMTPEDLRDALVSAAAGGAPADDAVATEHCDLHTDRNHTDEATPHHYDSTSHGDNKNHADYHLDYNHWDSSTIVTGGGGGHDDGFHGDSGGSHCDNKRHNDYHNDQNHNDYSYHSDITNPHNDYKWHWDHVDWQYIDI